MDKINTIREKLKIIQDSYKQAITNLFEDPEFENFGGFEYSPEIPAFENLTEVINDMDEELEMQRTYLKDYGEQSLRAWRFKENIKTLRKIVTRLKKLRIKLRESDFVLLQRELKLPVTGIMGYRDVLLFMFVYSEVIGFQNIQKFEYCVVDEGQDFSVLEYLVLGKLVINGRFCILGDLNQATVDDSISDWNLISMVIKEAKSANTFELDTNYRSTRPIIDYANSILGSYTQDYLPKSINRKGKDPVIKEYDSKEKLLNDFSREIEADFKELSKSIGVICFSDDLLKETEELIKSKKINGEHFVKLDTSKKIAYIPKGIYLTNQENCKGLEFSKVYVLGMNPQKIERFVDEKKAFVAVTRAMNELHIYFD